MNKQKLLIGTKLDCFYKTIEASYIHRLHNVFNSTEYSSGITEKILHSYPTFLLGNLINTAKIYKILNVNVNNVLLSRESIISHKSINIGDTVKIITVLKDIYEQQASNNPIGFIILESIGLKNNDILYYTERVYAVRGGFQRGSSL